MRTSRLCKKTQLWLSLGGLATLTTPFHNEQKQRATLIRTVPCGMATTVLLADMLSRSRSKHSIRCGVGNLQRSLTVVFASLGAAFTCLCFLSHDRDRGVCCSRSMGNSSNAWAWKVSWSGSPIGDGDQDGPRLATSSIDHSSS